MKKTIVIVDDDFDILTLLRIHFRYYETHEISVELFESPKKALEFIQANKVDLVITDNKMPEISGFELAQILKISSNKTLPIILHSSLDSNTPQNIFDVVLVKGRAKRTDFFAALDTFL